MSQYTHTTRAQFKSALTKALGDLDNIFWTDTELNSLLDEALLTFGTLANFWKTSALFETANAKRIYDLFSDTTGASFAPTLTYEYIINLLNLTLIEELSESSPISELFTLTELLNLIDSKYNVFQLETNLIVSNTEKIVAAQNNTVKFSDNILDIVRLKFKYTIDSIDYEVILQRDDEENISYFDPEALTEEEIPIYWSTVYGALNEIKLYPIPSVSGILEILSINGRDLTQPLTVDTLINLPNNLVPYLKYGVLQDIYNKDGVLNSPEKADYCNKRWQEGILVGRNYSSILTVKSNGLSIDTDSLNKLDAYSDILSASSNPPTVLGLAGFNIFEIDILPNTTVNSILALVISDAPLPTDDVNSYVEVEIGYINLLVNYCLHLAQLKCGIYELTTTTNYLQDFIRTSLAHNERMQNRGITYQQLMGRTKKEEQQLPRLTESNIQQAQV